MFSGQVRPSAVIILWPICMTARCRLSASVEQCCGSESESGSESERIRAFLAGTESESEIFVPDSDPDPNSDPVPDPVI
jgi:hypothetical protein